MSLLINGHLIETPGHVFKTWLDDPSVRLKMGQDGRGTRNTKWIRSLFFHTTTGKSPQVIKPGKGPKGKYAENVAHYWTGNSRSAGAHLILNPDGTWVQTADLALETAYHATSVNDTSIGIEIVSLDGTGPDRKFASILYSDQLDEAVWLADFLTAFFDDARNSPLVVAIPRQIQWPYDVNPVARLKAGGVDCAGVFAHYQQTADRGPGDPGIEFFLRLRAKDYESFDFSKNTDKTTWKPRQKGLKVTEDGVPGPATRKAILDSGRDHGLWPVVKI